MPTLLITSQSWDKSLMRHIQMRNICSPLDQDPVRSETTSSFRCLPAHSTSLTATNRAPFIRHQNVLLTEAGLNGNRGAVFTAISLQVTNFPGPPPAENRQLWQRPAQVPVLLKLSFNFLIPRLSGIPWQPENYAFHSSLPNLSFRWFLPSWLTI